MVRDIEKVLGTQIERRRAPDFDYGDFKPESYSRHRRSNQPHRHK